jgi:predicted GNAT family N-acyltransferase
LIDFSHISLFFVDGVRQKRGVGRQLMKRAVAACKKSRPEIKSLSVNSSPNAVNIYQNLGFIVSKPEQQTNGIRYVTMVLDLANALKLGYLTAGGPDRP